MRLAAYAGTSVGLAAAVVLKALHTRPNFYSVCVYFAESNAALMILSNLVLLIVGSILVGLQHLLYGPLRPIEIEQLYEKAWFAVTETCLAMTIFREELGVWFVVMFVSLLIAKVWGWIGEGRLEILEQQPPENPRLFHTRLSASLLLSMAFNAWLLNYSIETVRQINRPNMMVMFAFEFALVNVSSLSTLLRYGITAQEALIVREQTTLALQARRKEIEQERKAARDAAAEAGEAAPEEPPIEEVLEEADIDVPGWEEKSRWVFYLDLTTDFLRLVLYVTFFAVLCRLYGMPIHIIRDVALVVRSFYRRVTDFIKYRHATRDMHARYPDATAEEITTQDVCIICREGMRARPETTAAAAEAQPQAGAAPPPPPPPPLDERLRPKKLPCGHILHFACLRSWLERQQNCPTCRQPVLSSPTTTQPAGIANQAGNNPAGGLPPAANGEGQPPANPHQPNARLNRMRTFNLGPLRLTVGTGQIVRVPQAGANQAGQAHQQIQNPSPGHTDIDLTQAIRQHNHPTSSTTTLDLSHAIQNNINQLERMLMQETIRLRLQTEQLNVIRAMQTELGRLRVSQGMQQQVFGQMSAAAMPQIQSTAPAHLSTFTSNSHSEPLTSGSANLPPGVTIPEGWTLLPLQRMPDSGGLSSGPGPAMMAAPQQRSRSLGPSIQPGPSINASMAASNDLPSLAVHNPPSPPASSMFVAQSRPTATTSSSTPPPTNPVSGEGEQIVNNFLEALRTAQPSTTDGPSIEVLQPTPGVSSERPTAATTSEPSRAGGWQWPTFPQVDTPTSASIPTTENGQQRTPHALSTSNEDEHKTRTTTVEDASDEE